MSIPSHYLSRSQHAYSKGRSVETALHSLVGYIEKSFEQSEYALVAFLDIEGAFNNVTPRAITLALESLGVDRKTVLLLRNLLMCRVIVSSMGSSTLYRAVYRGTPQGGVLSPLLWNLTVNTLLVELDLMMVKTVAYADDIAIAVSGAHLPTLSDSLGGSLRLLSRWCTMSGLRANPTKTDLVLFTRKYKVPSFPLPRLEGVVLPLSDSAKYLGLILDSKLSWVANTQARVSKAAIAIYSCRRAIGKTWGITPYYSAWLFSAVVKPIMLYGVLVWWRALTRPSQCRRFDSILRSCALLITGALRTTPTKALLVMLNWLPADLMGTQVAVNAAIRLNAIGAWSSRNFGHANLLEHLNGIPNNIDYCTPSPFFDRDFSVSLSGNPPPGGSLEIYTDGSKSMKGVGGGFFIPLFRKRVSFRLPDDCSVLQAEISAIKRAVNWLRYYRVYELSTHICILSDSQAAVKSLSGVFTSSILTRECRASLNEMARHSSVVLSWVPSHSFLEGNLIADRLAKGGSLLSTDDIDMFVGIPLSSCRLKVERELFNSARSRWSQEHSCNIARQSWPIYDTRRSSSLLRFPRTQLRDLVAAFTGHCKIGLHARRLNLPFNDYCRSCHDEEEEETVLHLLCHCPALSGARLHFMGSLTLHDLTDLSGLDLRGINSFIRATGWFGPPESL